MRQEGITKTTRPDRSHAWQGTGACAGCARRCCYRGIRAELEAAGKPIGPNDLFIAAHASALGAVLVTANVGEFMPIRALRVENWLV